LQRYVENEPYEYGRRPEIYARMRHLAPKLLLVPEYRGTIFLLSCIKKLLPATSIKKLLKKLV
jgi:hypothetical protein